MASISVMALCDKLEQTLPIACLLRPDFRTHVRYRQHKWYPLPGAVFVKAMLRFPFWHVDPCYGSILVVKYKFCPTAAMSRGCGMYYARLDLAKGLLERWSSRRKICVLVENLYRFRNPSLIFCIWVQENDSHWLCWQNFFENYWLLWDLIRFLIKKI